MTDREGGIYEEGYRPSRSCSPARRAKKRSADPLSFAGLADRRVVGSSESPQKEVVTYIYPKAN